jgi:sigma-E factor negative regulatory protein RseA
MTEKLSALLDGHIDDEGAGRTMFETLRQDREMREKWGTYCLIGDALRGEAQGTPDLASKVLARLEGEPTVLAPARPSGGARSARLSRVMLPVAASVMGVSAVGWVAAKAAGKGATLVAAALPTPVAEDSLRSYVFAHQALAGGSPIPGVAQYVRTVTEVRQGPDR